MSDYEHGRAIDRAAMAKNAGRAVSAYEKQQAEQAICGEMKALPTKGEDGYPTVVACSLGRGHLGIHRP